MQYTRIVAALSLLGCITVAAAMPPTEASKFAAASKANLARKLKDPRSMQYRGLFISASEYEEDGKTYAIHSLCGEVNAKNGYGGYAGFRRFVANATVPGGQIDQPDDEAAAYAFEQVAWARRCSNKIQDVR